MHKTYMPNAFNISIASLTLVLNVQGLLCDDKYENKYDDDEDAYGNIVYKSLA